MKITINRYLAVALGAFAFGCAAQAIGTQFQAAPVAAQSEPQNGVYQECIAATVAGVSGRELSGGVLPEATRIPAGWHVVGGGGSGRPSPFVVLCR